MKLSSYICKTAQVMKSTAIIFFLFTTGLLAQSESLFSSWGYLSAGASRVNYTDSDHGVALQFGVGIQYCEWRIKFDRRVNNQITLFNPEEKINANSILVGYSVKVKENYPHFLLIGNVGYSNVQSFSRGKIISSKLFDTKYEIIKRRTHGFLFEGGFELRLYKYFGISGSLYTNINPIRAFYGVSAGVLIGYI